MLFYVLILRLNSFVFRLNYISSCVACWSDTHLSHFHSAPHVKTRHGTLGLSSSCILVQELDKRDTATHDFFCQEKVVTCCVALVLHHGATRSSRQERQARLARHVFRGFATAWTGVDMCTSLFFQKLFLRLIQSQSTKD